MLWWNRKCLINMNPNRVSLPDIQRRVAPCPVFFTSDGTPGCTRCSASTWEVPANLQPRVSVQAPTWPGMWLQHSLNTKWEKSITLIPWITQRPWFVPPRDEHALGPNLTWLSGCGMCVFFQKQKTSKHLLSPSENVSCTVRVEEGPGAQRPKGQLRSIAGSW